MYRSARYSRGDRPQGHPELASRRLSAEWPRSGRRSLAPGRRGGSAGGDFASRMDSPSAGRFRAAGSPVGTRDDHRGEPLCRGPPVSACRYRSRCRARCSHPQQQDIGVTGSARKQPGHSRSSACSLVSGTHAISRAAVIAKWQRMTGVTVSEWGIRRMKTRWGTCNARARRIWLNLELAKKPPSCLEYILVHEMIHLRERHHNARFRELMDNVMPQWRVWRDILNRSPLAHEDWTY